MLKHSIKYSVLCGVFLIALFWVSIWLKSNPFIESRHFFFDLVVFFLFTFFACKEHKDFRNNGIFHFWEGISIGFIVLIPAVLIFSIFLFSIFRLNPTLMEEYYRTGAKLIVDTQKEFLIENFGVDSIAEQYRLIEERTPFDVVLRNSFWKVLTGFLVTPVIAIILRKQPN